jgi:hypothetical protein
MLPTILINPLSIALSLSTMFGVVIHDTKIDQLTGTMLAVPAIIATYEGVGAVHALQPSNPHTHSEQLSLSQAVRNLAMQSPRMQPRSADDRKHLLQRNVMRGYHPFDNYYLPELS